MHRACSSGTSSRLRAGRKLVLIHGNADPDALGCAYALRSCFPDVDICAPQGLDRISKVISRKLGFEPLGTRTWSVYDLMLVVDTSSPEQLGEMNRPTPDWIVIDHHARTISGLMPYYCDDTQAQLRRARLRSHQESHVTLDKPAGLALLWLG